ALARDLVDLVDADDAARGLLDVAAGGAEQRLDHALDVLTNIAGFGKRGRVRDREWNVELLRERLSEQRLAGPGRSDQQDIALLELDLGLFAAQADAFVVVVNGHRQRTLGVLLPHHVAIQLFDDRPWRRVLGPLRSLFFREDVVAQSHALVADEDARTADELSHFAPLLAAERAVELFHVASPNSYMFWGLGNSSNRLQ